MAAVATMPEMEFPMASGFGDEDEEEGRVVQYLSPPESRKM
jgi:hypothetical protein